MFQCQECGRLFRTVRAAEKASYEGCPKCGGVDIDLANPDAERQHAERKPTVPCQERTEP